MQALIKPGKYPMEVRKVIFKQSSLGIALANRWMLGWPKQVDNLLAQTEYLAAFLTQVETERQALLSLSQQDWGHLAQHEKMQMLEVNPAPPMIS